MKGLILAGGSGTRLYPATQVVSKQLLPVYDKPLIYYPLTTLMLAGIRDILIISTPQDTPRFEQLLGDGSQWGLRLQYAVQPDPGGLAQAFIIGRDFVGGDTLVPDPRRQHLLRPGSRGAAAARRRRRSAGATVFAYPVQDPERYGVVEFDAAGRAVSLEEKPAQPKSRYAVTGLYFYDNQVLDIAASLKPSAARRARDHRRQPRVPEEESARRRRRSAAATPGSTPARTNRCWRRRTSSPRIEGRQSFKIACPEEIAYRMDYITAAQLEALAQPLAKNGYGQYLLRILSEKQLKNDRGQVASDRPRVGCRGRSSASTPRELRRSLRARFMRAPRSTARSSGRPHTRKRPSNRCAPSACSSCFARLRRSGYGEARPRGARSRIVSDIRPAAAAATRSDESCAQGMKSRRRAGPFD